MTKRSRQVGDSGISIKSTAGAKRHPPAMYPDPAPIELATPLKIVAVDPKTRTITVERTPELAEIESKERRRLDLTARLKQYARTCLIRIAPHWGERPKHVSPAKWKNLEQRVRAMTQLPETAPADAHDALKALQALNRLTDELVEADDYPESIERAFCYAIDLGQLLQRGQTQRDYGKVVDAGKRSKSRSTNANAAKSKLVTDKIEAAHAEFNRRMKTVTETRKKNQTLIAMSKVKNTKGKPLWGSIAALNRYANHWNSITPPE